MNKLDKKNLVFLTSSVPKCGVRDYSEQLAKDLQKGVNSYGPLNVDLLYFNKQKPFDVYFKLVSVILRKRVACIHVQHEFGIFDNFFALSFFFSYIFLIVLRMLGIRLYVTFHTIFPLQHIESDLDPKWTKNTLIKRLVVSYIFLSVYLLSIIVNKCIALSKPAKKVLIYDYKVSEKKIIEIPHGVQKISTLNDEASSREFKKDYGIDKQHVISQVGFCYKGKGYEHLIRALPIVIEECPNIKLIITAGFTSYDSSKSIDYCNFIKNEIQKNKVENYTIMTGYLEEKKLTALLNITDVFVFPYDFRVNASGASNLVLNTGKPLVVSEIPLFSELINEKIAIPVNPVDKEQLAKAVVKCLFDKEFRTETESKIKAYAEKNSSQVAAIEHFNLYN